MTKKVLVYGYYNKSNLGDDLFADAFKGLFPDYEFTFVDKIKLPQLDGVDAVFFGGGSFLAETLKATDEAFEELKKRKLFYIGVGTETSLDPRHQELMSLAEVVAVRTNQNLENVVKVNSKAFVIPDLVYSLTPTLSENKIPKSILVVPNILVTPKWSCPHWKHSAWEYFKMEFVQTVDELIADGFKIDFLPFCTNSLLNDSYAAAELIAKSNTITPKKLWEKPQDFQSAIDIISQYQLVVTQRFHGNILANIAGVPTLTIYHHDKLKGAQGKNLSYYGISKALLLDSIKDEFGNSSGILPIDRNIFVELKKRVEDALRRN